MIVWFVDYVYLQWLSAKVFDPIIVCNIDMRHYQCPVSDVRVTRPPWVVGVLTNQGVGEG